jgi:hypothetical protein
LIGVGLDGRVHEIRGVEGEVGAIGGGEVEHITTKGGEESTLVMGVMIVEDGGVERGEERVDAMVEGRVGVEIGVSEEREAGCKDLHREKREGEGVSGVEGLEGIDSSRA